MGAKTWSEPQIRRIRRLITIGLTLSEISQRTGQTINSINYVLKKAGIKPKALRQLGRSRRISKAGRQLAQNAEAPAIQQVCKRYRLRREDARQALILAGFIAPMQFKMRQQWTPDLNNLLTSSRRAGKSIAEIQAMDEFTGISAGALYQQSSRLSKEA